MGRRSIHSPEELRQLILTASRAIIEKDGLPGLSAREIAREIGYSPGTLYNIFENLDDVLLTLQVELLGDLVTALKAVPPSPILSQNIDDLADAYLSFALERRHMWNLLSAHYPEAGTLMPQALHENVNAAVGIISNALKPALDGADAQQIDATARALWAGVHGVTAIAATSKGPTMSASAAKRYVRILTSTFVKGLEAKSR